MSSNQSKASRRLAETARPLLPAARAQRRKEYEQAGYDGSVSPLAMLGGTLADGALLSLARLMGRGQKPDHWQVVAAESHAALAVHRQHGWDADPAGYHERPAAPTSVKLRRHGQWQIVTYDSDYEPRPGEPGADRWLAREANRTAILRVHRVGLKAPWLVLIHGAGMGGCAPTSRPSTRSESLSDYGSTSSCRSFPCTGNDGLPALS